MKNLTRLYDIKNKTQKKAMGEFDLSLIREFRTRPGFYDRNSPLFKDKVYNAREWQQIANKLGYDVSLLKDRMLQLRNRYNLEKRRLEQFHDENPGKHIDSPWPLYEELTFLSEHIRARRSYKRLLPVNAISLSSLNKSSSSSSYYNLNEHTQQLYNQQYYNDDETGGGTSNLNLNGVAGVGGGGIGDANSDAASHDAARFAANGLLAVKMEELDDDDDDNEMQTQDLSEDNFEHNVNGTTRNNNNNNDVEDKVGDIRSSNNLQQHQLSFDRIYRQQLQEQQQQQHLQKQQHKQQQQQQQERQNETNNSRQKHSYQQQIQQKGSKKFCLPSLDNNSPSATHYKNQIFSQQQKQHNHNKQRLKQQQQQHHHQEKIATRSSGAYDLSTATYLKQSSSFAAGLNQRMQKYVAFGNFMSTSLSELPQQKALMLVEKFTSEVVKVMLLKHMTTSGIGSNGNNNSNNKIIIHNNGNGNGKKFDDSSNNHNMTTNSDGIDDIDRKVLADMIMSGGNVISGSSGGLIDNIALSSSSSSVVDANGIEDRDH